MEAAAAVKSPNPEVPDTTLPRRVLELRRNRCPLERKLTKKANVELYREFFALVRKLDEARIDYAVVGGIALAFHGQPRFTKDIDILAKPADLETYERVFAELGYFKTSSPWTFSNTNITLHRFGKPSADHPEELILVDLLIGNEEVHRKIIERSLSDSSAAGKVMLATKEDLIWMKKQRSNKQDEADIESLESNHDKN